jgi:hypothetical protein
MTHFGKDACFEGEEMQEISHIVGHQVFVAIATKLMPSIEHGLRCGGRD